MQIEKAAHLDIDKSDYKLLKQGIDVADKIGNIIKAVDFTEEPASVKSYAFCSDTLYDENIVKYTNFLPHKIWWRVIYFIENDREIGIIIVVFKNNIQQN